MRGWSLRRGRGLAGHMANLAAASQDPDGARQRIVVQGALKCRGAATNEVDRGRAIEMAPMMVARERVAAVIAIHVQVASATETRDRGWGQRFDQGGVLATSGRWTIFRIAPSIARAQHGTGNERPFAGYPSTAGPVDPV